MLRSLPVTAPIATSGRYRRTTPQSSVTLGKSGSAAASSWARAMTERREPWGGWDRARDDYPDGLPSAQRLHAVSDDPLIDQRPRRIMKQHIAVGGERPAAQGRDGLPGRVGTGRAARNDPDELAVPAQLRRRLADELSADHNEHLVDARGLVERRHAMLNERPARQHLQLLGHAP